MSDLPPLWGRAYASTMRVLLGAFLGLVACSGSGSTVGDPPCSSGETGACVCADGASGTRICSQGRLGACECASPPDPRDGAPPPTDSCTPRSWFRDGDGDGFGAGAPLSACDKPAGYVESSNDCAPEDARAFPGQTRFFETAITGPAPSGQQFDFDCDRAATMSQPDGIPATKSNCEADPCVPGLWANGTPACGVTGSWDLLCATASPTLCDAASMGPGQPPRKQKRQACR